MPPLQDNKSAWDLSTTIELIALLLIIPGAIAAIATLTVLKSRYRSRIRQGKSPPWSQSNPSRQETDMLMQSGYISRIYCAFNSLARSKDESTTQACRWFQTHFRELKQHSSSDRQRWMEEVDLNARQNGRKNIPLYLEVLRIYSLSKLTSPRAMDVQLKAFGIRLWFNLRTSFETSRLVYFDLCLAIYLSQEYRCFSEPLLSDPSWESVITGLSLCCSSYQLLCLWHSSCLSRSARRISGGLIVYLRCSSSHSLTTLSLILFHLSWPLFPE